MGIKTFWVELLPIVDWRYTYDAPGPCSVHGERHKAEKLFPGIADGEALPEDRLTADCACGFHFADWETGHGTPRYRRLADGTEIRGRLPPGALYVAELMKRQDGWEFKGADGLNVVCVLPNGSHWYIDSRASNCTLPQDNVHRCWVRHGTRGGVIHVDKNGHTCAAGAGSIQSGDYHGFLHNGELT